MSTSLHLVFLLLSIGFVFSAGLSNLKVLSDEEMRVLRTLRFYDQLREQDADGTQTSSDSGTKYCPASHPFAYNNGAHCCATGYEKYYRPSGWRCDNSAISLSSTCCFRDNYTPCPSGRCASRKPESLCPKSHPFPYNQGLYCCARSYEKQYRPFGRYCDASEISYTSRCCNGDKYIKCPKGLCKDVKRDCVMECGRVWNPVCGTDGKDYINYCLLKKERCLKNSNLSIKYNARCPLNMKKQ